MADKYKINENEVHIWHYSLDPDNSFDRTYMNILSDEEVQKINRTKIRDVRIKRIISKAVVKTVVSNYLGVEIKRVKFSYNEFGKPFIPDDLKTYELNFSISHSGNLGAIALAKNNRLGIDTEQIIELCNIDDLIDLCFSNYEKNLFTELEYAEKTVLFYKIWTGKEAFVKAIGKGLSFPLKNISFGLNDRKEMLIHEILEEDNNLYNWGIYNFNPKQNYISSLVIDSNSFQIKVFDWNQSEILI